MKIRLIYFILIIGFCACQHPNVLRINTVHKNGTPESVSYYYKENNKKKLKYRRLFYDNGQLKMEGHFKNGLKHGYWVFFFENGRKSDMAWFIKGKLNGRTVTYYENGNLRYAGFYKNGERIRKWIFFDEEGKLTKKINYSKQ